MKGRVLIIAGSDSGGGAGIQADIKAVTALRGYAATAIAALTAQDTHTVHAIHDVPLPFVRLQIELTLKDIGADAIKTGMLNKGEVIAAVREELDLHAPETPLIVDPVMVAKGGARLLNAGAERALIERLLPRATLITPNASEAEVLTGLPVNSFAEQDRAAERLLALGARAVLLKGGHLPGEEVRDVLLTPQGRREFKNERLHTTSTHGTGCTLASAIATGLAQKLELHEAVSRAHAYVWTAIRTAPGLGGGNGPLNHTHTVKPDA
ncbi:bifunctional hydroxymethylpyrimidine kinase/phosphomethylpyrimidine kinase [Melittangium boletus]|uniref:hydroxymethylpyrimidine kinase n=1 Tax=Melittangium boletus DSM 14713 TaxID=1294270 RepID=A0A250IPY2_9BACT|nr:bifunctional hydroxymethylpyrimidine kinase/phosphomethylpyrimidine kinase [Melittangium boletus]ATB33338.1 hydroxymethylpyrimidine/phosphomethylpyrimidine kinase [Melittangium boletus DSM 14713]